jgi:hypothetical protein
MVLGRSHEETEDEKIDVAGSIISNTATAFDSIDKSRFSSMESKLLVKKI